MNDSLIKTGCIQIEMISLIKYIPGYKCQNTYIGINILSINILSINWIYLSLFLLHRIIISLSFY